MGETRAVRVLISYAHGEPAEDELVRQFWTLLCNEGIDARIDLTAADQPSSGRSG